MKQWISLCVCLASLALVACDRKQSISPDAIPFQSKSDGKWGLVQTDGKMLFEEEFKSEPTLSFNGRFFVMNSDGKWEIYTTGEKPEKVGDEYDGIAPFFSDVTVSVKKGERINIIDRDGDVKATLDKAAGKPITKAYAFREGYAVIETADGYGLINTKGDVVIKPEYAEMSPCVSEGKLLVVEKKWAVTNEEKQEWAVIDCSGKKLFSIKGGKYEEMAHIFVHGKLAVKDEDGWGFLDDKGEVVVKPSSNHKKIKDWNEDYFIFYDGESYGLKDFDGRTKIRAKYDELLLAGEGTNLLIAGDDSEYFIIDYEGEKVSKEKFGGILPSLDGAHFIAQLNRHEFGFIDKSGEQLKETPDIYNLGFNVTDDYVTSDYVDVDAIADQCEITTNSLGGITFDMTAEQVAKAFDPDANPLSFMYQSRIMHSKDIASGIQCEFDIEFEDEVVANVADESMDGSDFRWMNVKPCAITADFKGLRVDEKLANAIYEKIKSKLLSLGDEIEAESGEDVTLVKLGNGRVGVCSKNNYSVNVLIIPEESVIDEKDDDALPDSAALVEGAGAAPPVVEY